MHFLGIQGAVADQFVIQQQDRNFVPPAHAHGRIRIHIDEIDRKLAAGQQPGEFLGHALAQMTAFAGIEQKARRIPAQWVAAFPRRTDCAMYFTVCSGTSPTAVT